MNLFQLRPLVEAKDIALLRVELLEVRRNLACTYNNQKCIFLTNQR